jgi:chromate reductase
MALPKVTVINGSLRKDSINRKLALAIANLAAGKLEMKLLEISGLPLYNQDFDADYPAVAQRVKDEIAAADAVLFVTPEHNRSIPAALKNVIDWVSRPYGTGKWQGKVAGIVCTSAGQVGTAIAQDHLRSILVAQGIAVMGRPEIYFIYKDGVFDAQHNVSDPQAKKILEGFVEAFAKWIGRVPPAG